ncbi:hypothetical protein D770_05425 [Flammeovirgaceae bacterium 311]|nr:hypothetical protein D770_05425 [Flammeovirgaceae bacterium 311]
MPAVKLKQNNHELNTDVLINDYLSIVFANAAVEGFELDPADVEKKIAFFVRRKAMEHNMGELEILHALNWSSESVRIMFQGKILGMISQIQQATNKASRLNKEELARIDVTKLMGDKEYRYHAAAILKIYEYLKNKGVWTESVPSRQSVNVHLKGKLRSNTALLPVIERPREFMSVLESNLIEYFRIQTQGYVLKPEEIRKFAYKQPAPEEPEER